MKSKIKIPLDALEISKLRTGVMFTWEVKDSNEKWVEVKIKYDRNGKWVDDEED